MQDFVDTLLRLDDGPVLTVTVSLDRHQPASHADRIRFRNLVADARLRLDEMADRSAAEAITARLDDAVTRVDLGAGAQGVVVVATAESAEVRALPFPVRDDVSLGSTPATRSLVQGLCRSPRYRVLVVSDRATRLFEAVRDRLVEVEAHGFPMAAHIVRRDRRAMAGRFALAPGGDDKERWRRFYRGVDRALRLASRGDPLPIVLVGVRRSTHLFRAVSTSAHLVVGHVDGAHDRVSPGSLGVMTWEVMRNQLRARRAAVIAELDEAVAAGQAVTGLDEVWQFAREGRGHLLVVEEDYRAEPSREHEGRVVPADGADVEFADPVDEVVEHVLRARGSVEFVAPDTLVRRGRIGLILR
jgi:hypothetical protein